MDELRQKLSQRRSARKPRAEPVDDCDDGAINVTDADGDDAASVADVAVQLFGPALTSRARTSGASTGSVSSMFSGATEVNASRLSDGRDRSTQGSGRSLSSGSTHGNPSHAGDVAATPLAVLSAGASAGGAVTPRTQRQSTHALSARAAVRAACGATEVSTADRATARPWRLSLFRHMASTPGRESIKRLFPRKRDE